MVGVYFSGATAPTCLHTVPTLTPARRAIFSLSSIVCPDAAALAADVGLRRHYLGF